MPTLAELLRLLVLEQPGHARPFLISYRSCVTSVELWNAVCRLERVLVTLDARDALVRFLQLWLECCFEADFHRHRLLSKLLAFASARLTQEQGNALKISCLRSATALTKRGSTASRLCKMLATPRIAQLWLLPSTQRVSMLKAHKTDALAWALRSISGSLVTNVRPSELLNNNWQRPERATLAPGLVALTDYFNHISFLVASEILAGSPGIQPTKSIKKSIKLLRRCVDLDDLHSAAAVCAGLNLSCVQRLRRAWLALSADVRVQFEAMDELLSPQKNWSRYRAFLREAQRHDVAVVPYVAVLLRDLTFISDGNADGARTGQDAVLNWEKLQMLGSNIANFVDAQQCFGAPLPISADVEAVLSAPVFGEERLDQLSQAFEPRKEAAIARTNTSSSSCSSAIPSRVSRAVPRPASMWTAKEVAAWAESAFGSLLAELFVAASVDGPCLVSLDDSALVEIGVNKKEHRKRIIKEVQRITMRRSDSTSSFSESNSSSDRHASDPRQWTAQDVKQWLLRLEEIKLASSMPNLTGSELQVLNVEALPEENVINRRRLQKKIRRLFEMPGTPSSTRASGRGYQMKWAAESNNA